MKTMKYLSMMLAVLVMSVCMFSCGDDDDEKNSNDLSGTQWAYTDVYSDGTREQILSFNKDNTATLVISVKNAGGVIVNSESISYTYQRSENLVVLTAQQAGKANLEGVISSTIKMEITNTSNQKVVGTFYKK